jgi:hypothetical protein
MSQSWLNSLANSSLNATLEASESVRNPLIYSTKEITPAHAVSWNPITPVTGDNVTANGTTTFQLNKYGVISQILLNYTRSRTNDDVAIPANDFLKLISRVDLMCSSRVIASLTRDDLRAQFSNLTDSEFNPVLATCIKSRVALATGTDDLDKKYTVPLHFCFQDHINTCLDASFLEPLQLTVVWGNNFNIGASASTVKDCSLKVRYINMPESQVAKTISENYDAPELNILTSRFVDEAPQTMIAKTGAAAVQTASVQLKSTECVEDFYCSVYKDVINNAADLDLAEIVSVEFKSSGQSICEFSTEELRHVNMYENGWAVEPDYTVASSGNYNRVIKIPLGYFTDDKLSNMASLREMSNPEIVIKFKTPTLAADTVYRITVVERCTALYAINSSSGRINLSLSN